MNFEIDATEQSRLQTALPKITLGLGFIASFTTILASILYFLDMPIYDYWDVLYGSSELEGKGLRAHLDFYWTPFVDQKMVFPKVLIERLFSWTGNAHYALEIAFGLVCQGACAAICFRLGYQKNQKQLNSIRLGVVLLLLFWPCLSFRFQHHWYSTQYSLSITPGLLAIYLFQCYPQRWCALAAALFFTLVGALSHGTGLFLSVTWIVVMPFIGAWSKLQRAVFGLANASLVALVIMLKPSQELIHLPPLIDSLETPVQFVLFFFRCFGPKIHGGAPGFLIFGLFVTALSRLFRQGALWDQSNAAWVIVGLWSCSVAGGSALARSSLGSNPSHVYFSFFVFFWIATFHFAMTAGLFTIPKARGWRWLGFVFIGYLLAVYGTGVEKGLRHVRVQHRKMRGLKRSLEFAALTEAADLTLIFPYPRIRSQTLPMLYEKRLLPDFVNLEELTEVSDYSLQPTIQAGELIVKLGRPLKVNEVLLIQSQSRASPTVYWRVNESWQSDRWAPLVKYRNGQLWIRPSPRFSADQVFMKVGGVQPDKALRAVKVTVWQREARPAGR